ncbi:Exocyst complex component EXO70B1 [Vitis vinifera]|uniref:Exocyst subunit Exo70 family protein n=1 Tax=Vitis vinifera TaxID=29760 RepID=A0A438EY30_VITVI|nr:Exocyst complex component EXO70B1 [Vitis vinifera]
MATTTTISGGGGAGGAGGEDRVMATAQQIVKSLNTTKEVTEDMLLIFSSFDNRLSNISNLIETKTEVDQFEAAEKVIMRWDSNSEASRHTLPWDEAPEEAAEYLAAVDEILQMTEDLAIRSDGEMMDRAESALQVAMTRLEDEFRHILIRNTVPLDADRLYGSIRRVSLSFPTNEGEIMGDFDSFVDDDQENSCYHERGGSLGDDVCVDLIQPDAVAELKEIANRMIRSGYEKECCQVYSSVRRDVLDECLSILGVEKLSIEEVQKIEWRSLDEKMKKWMQAVKIVVRVLLWGEKRLCDQAFSGSDLIKEVCFTETAKSCVMQLLNFGEAVAIGRRSSEKLFRILDMYDALADVLPDLEALFSDESGQFVWSEAEECWQAWGKRQRERLQSLRMQFALRHPGDPFKLGNTPPIGRRLLLLMSCLESNLTEKSKLYEDNAMQYIFLMNNILYIVQKVKDSELGKILGDHWVRKRRGQIRQYATSYLRASWSKVLACLKDEGIGGSSSNASKMALKERFKNFNACFEDIYRIQTAWKVHDAQLREELRISISEKVIPAYRSFMGRFGNNLESGRNAGKYIKYTPEDLENYLLDLFEGSSLVLHHMRRKTA